MEITDHNIREYLSEIRRRNSKEPEVILFNPFSFHEALCVYMNAYRLGYSYDNYDTIYGIKMRCTRELKDNMLLFNTMPDYIQWKMCHARV